MATKFYGQAQIYTNLPGMICPLCQKPVEPNVGHYCEVREKPTPAQQWDALVSKLTPEQVQQLATDINNATPEQIRAAQKKAREEGKDGK